MAAMSNTLSYIQAHLDSPLSPLKLASQACYSLQHFHRVFRAVVGESVMDHIRRIRLERAAYRLKTTHESVGLIALDAGYSAQEAFTRIFQAYFGIGPRTYRYTHASHLIPSVSGVHYSPGGCTPLRRVIAPELLDDEGVCLAHKSLLNSSEEQLEYLLSMATELYFSESPRPYIGGTEDPMSEFTAIDNEIDDILADIEAAKQRLIEVRKRRPKERVKDYVLKDIEGRDVRLSDLFAGKDDLIVVHNMGAFCIYCTVWADGITGLVPHFQDRASLVVCSPDPPEVQKRFAEKRGWTFTMVSAVESDFPKEMGFWGPDGPWPGVSTFKKEADGTIHRVGKTHLGSVDGQNSLWPIFELLEGGVKDWEPKFSYGDGA